MVRLARWSLYQGDLNIVILKRAGLKVVFSARWSDYQGGHVLIWPIILGTWVIS